MPADRPTFEPSPRRLAGFLTFAVIALVLALGTLREDHIFATRGVAATGEILKSDGPKRPYTVRFTTKSGQIVVAETVNRNGGDKEVGDSIRIVYDSRHPSTMQEERSLYYVWPAVFGAFGLAMATVGVALHLRDRKRNSSQSHLRGA
ncbi:DUF3592 domain-containing protein [Frankia sp. EI5c]|uniref:DUF3592 domain-containing protein n=1 Tax=Frankia sp. EI5c TaxID=683316 RepID=UPI0037C0A0A1